MSLDLLQHMQEENNVLIIVLSAYQRHEVHQSKIIQKSYHMKNNTRLILCHSKESNSKNQFHLVHWSNADSTANAEI